MFEQAGATAMLPAADINRALAWYADKLGLAPSRVSGEGMGAVFELNGVRVFLYSTPFAGTAQHTLLSFDSDNLVEDMRALRERGVVFIDYDLPGLKTKNGLAQFGPVKNAWCKDSEGNILGFVEGI
jgi:catechol 2,3-dioxygenase-like lactoylglutathione lyase family enzyme